MAQAWKARPIALTLPLDQARAMWRRALQWDVSEGGRFEVRTCRTMMIWAGARDDDGEGPAAEPLGSIGVRWHTPTEDSATICRLAWKPTGGGSEELVWQALQTLAGVAAAHR